MNIIIIVAKTCLTKLVLEKYFLHFISKTRFLSWSFEGYFYIIIIVI